MAQISQEQSGNNDIAEARRRIAEAKRIGAEELDIGGLGLTEIPEELLELTQLKVLYLGLPKAAAEKPYLRRTEEDKKSCNAVRALPPALFTSLLHLTHLHLEHNDSSAPMRCLRSCSMKRAMIFALLCLAFITGASLAQTADAIKAIEAANIAVVQLIEKGQYAEGLQLALKTLEQVEKELGKEHPDTLTSLGNLAAY